MLYSRQIKADIAYSDRFLSLTNQTTNSGVVFVCLRVCLSISRISQRVVDEC